jgi:hypothetical protein
MRGTGFLAFSGPPAAGDTRQLDAACTSPRILDKRYARSLDVVALAPLATVVTRVSVGAPGVGVSLCQS